jgi:hypothetical protein
MELNIGEITLIVLALTQWLKTKLELEGKVAELASFGVGFALGGAYQFTVTKPADAVTWLTVLVVAIGMGLVPSGLYKFAGALADRFSSKPVVDTTTKTN